MFILFICVFIEYYYMHYYYKVTAKNKIEEIKTNFRFFPKHYALPPRWIRKRFKLKKEEIPKFLLCRLLGSALYFILSFIMPFIFLFAQFNSIIKYIIVATPLFCALLDQTVFVIMSLVFKRK